MVGFCVKACWLLMNSFTSSEGSRKDMMDVRTLAYDNLPDRRAALKSTAIGFGQLAFASLLQQQGWCNGGDTSSEPISGSSESNDAGGIVLGPHHKARAKRVVFFL